MIVSIRNSKGDDSMPLYLIRHDLTTMDCDAIVNPSNVHLQPGGGLDAAIHQAAGPALLDACRNAAPCPVGQARITPAFRLPSKWVIHTAAPVWHGGLFGEKRLLAACYRSCVACAQDAGCETLAVPLLGAGSNGIPVKLVLPVALQTLEDCLRKTDMTVYLVVFSKDAFALSKNLHADVQSYIDDNYVRLHSPKRSGSVPRRLFDRQTRGSRAESADNRRPGTLPDSEHSAPLQAPVAARDDLSVSLPPYSMAEGYAPADMPAPQTEMDFLLQLDEPFAVKLLKLIDQKQMDDVACYKKANVSRQTWYKILNEKGYKPNKKTVLSFAVALELTLDETQTLLESVGFVLSNSSLFDVIVMYCLSHGLYDVAQIDAILFQYDQETLYSKA
jgi:Predicted phosphatase homologous to the C-terminal domain of histone macroH2A1